jgi:transposase
VVLRTLVHLGQRTAALAGTVAEPEAQIASIVDDMAPGLVASEPGLGCPQRRPDPAVLVARRRIRSEAAFAMLAGAAPVPVSSGRTDRHLNRSGFICLVTSARGII